ncbi:TonB-dependent receptor [Candidatus Albibeggiatoa sp. nov. NOAA]|uniref:TonB-dependent receptor plug domain-containing protein n=1 Tax=Candidatus Albibeggiatoa sp. nov. NOAA TaxID=3162724 RepID=UPI0032FAB285|nr:TonB-dependent receptor [Thiotrichaceae bacterium]
MLYRLLKLIILILLQFYIAIPTYAENAVSDEYKKSATQLSEAQQVVSYLTQLDFEELFDIDILDISAFSAAKKQQKIADTAAALFVITQEDIRRAGITHIAEALRLAPGIQVARIDANKWAITARGFNDLYTSKLLVMIDGRTVYNPLRSEVMWSLQDLFIEDVERIEIIRGPGASLWGANAVNGVINILTKSAKKTEGGLVSATIGKGEENAILGYRHGGKIKDNMYFRAYGKLYQHDNFLDAQNQDVKNEWKMRHAGFRMDWEVNDKNDVSVQGDIYQGDLNQRVLLLYPTIQPYDDTTSVHSYNILTSWKRNTDKNSTTLQSYVTHNRYQDIFYKEKRDIFDIDWQQHYIPSEHYEIVWGLGYRYTRDYLPKEDHFVTYNPQQQTDHLFSAFIQNEFWLKPEKLRLTLGSKFEHNDYTGIEIQPTARLLWKLDQTKSAWAAVSRAVRTPSRTDQTLTAKYASIEPPFALSYASGTPNFKSETLVAYELGLHWQLTSHSFVDASLFFNDYDRLRITGLSNVSFDPIPTLYFEFENGMRGEIFGAELAGVWQITNALDIKASYTYTKTQLHVIDPEDNTVFNWEAVEENDPNHQVSLNLFWSISPRWEFDMSFYYVDDLPNQKTPDYTRVDLRLGWQPHPDWHFSLGVRNAFDRQHKEFDTGINGNIAIPSDVRRATYLQVRWQY